MQEGRRGQVSVLLSPACYEGPCFLEQLQPWLCLLQDVNDNAPVFLNQSYEFSVFEDSPGRSCVARTVEPVVAQSVCLLATECLSPPTGALVGNVEATDADRTEINSRISFLLERSSGSSNFLIRSSRLEAGHYVGQLTVDPDMSLDYDTLQEKFFSLVVVAENTAAYDVGDNASVPVVVHILDVNDEPPTIQPVSQDIHVSENGTQQGLVVTLVASDPDTNHSLVFEELAVTCFKDGSSAGDVCWDWFLLAPNGSVLVNSSDIDYELCDTVVLTLRAEDLYTEKGNRYSQNGNGTRFPLLPPPLSMVGAGSCLFHLPGVGSRVGAAWFGNGERVFPALLDWSLLGG